MGFVSRQEFRGSNDTDSSTRCDARRTAHSADTEIRAATRIQGDTRETVVPTCCGTEIQEEPLVARADEKARKVACGTCSRAACR